jgi:hypothetical protein
MENYSMALYNLFVYTIPKSEQLKWIPQWVTVPSTFEKSNRLEGDSFVWQM